MVANELNATLDSIESAERQLVQSRQEQATLEVQLGAAERLASIGRLAAGIAHELGTPLGTVAGRVQRLQRRAELVDSARKELDEVATEVRGMTQIVQEVLDFGRREGFRRKRVSTEEVLVGVRANLAKDIVRDKPARLEIVLQQPEIWIEIDAPRVELALANLVRNAFQMASTTFVRVSVQDRRDYICFVVEDDGPGVSDTLKIKIFEPFFTTRHEGTGLGLAIVAAVAHEHQGNVSVDASELGGARFEVRFPKQTDSPNETASQESAEHRRLI